MIDNYNQNPNQLQYTAINPSAMSNMQTLQDINGTQTTNAINSAVQGTQIPAQSINSKTLPLPPQGVQTQIMPDNNLQTY